LRRALEGGSQRDPSRVWGCRGQGSRGQVHQARGAPGGEPAQSLLLHIVPDAENSAPTGNSA
jgi:hypothetical protein